MNRTIAASIFVVMFPLTTADFSEVSASEQKPLQLTYLTEEELAFLQTHWGPNLSGKRDPNSYRAVQMELTAGCEWLLSGADRDPSHYFEPVLVNVLSIGDFAPNQSDVIQNIEAPRLGDKKPDFAFVWARIATKSGNPTIIVTGTVLVREHMTDRIVRVVRACRSVVLRDKLWRTVEQSLQELPQY